MMISHLITGIEPTPLTASIFTAKGLMHTRENVKYHYGVIITQLFASFFYYYGIVIQFSSHPTFII
jgi:hypothetical protein